MKKEVLQEEIREITDLFYQQKSKEGYGRLQELIADLSQYVAQIEEEAKRQELLEALTEALAKIGEKMDYAINVEVPDADIIDRMSGRRACVACGGTYHIKYNPTKKEGICDACGGELILRDDDKPETVKQRLEVYHTQTQPLIDYYTKEGILKEVDGTQDLQKVFEDIVTILD